MEGTTSHLARLLKHTRLASHHPAQVYVSPPAFAARGDFGLKRPLPVAGEASSSPSESSSSSRNARFVQVSKPETPEGQTEWRENERDTLFLQRWSEKGARLAGFAESQWQSRGASISTPFSRRPHGSLGPRIRTVFDPATYRLLPTDIPDPATADDPADARHFEGLKSMTKAGAVTPPGLDDPFASASSYYTRQLDTFPDYHSMTEKEFERFLRQVRQSRTDLRRRLQARTEHRIRQAMLMEAKRARERALQDAQDAAERGATPPTVAPLPQADELNLPRARTDMWDESRIMESLEVVGFLKHQEATRATRAENKTLPVQQGRETRPHPSGGLQYSQPDEIFTQRLSEPLPGRVIVQNLQDLSRASARSTSTKRNNDLGVASGGHVEQLPVAVRENLVPFDPQRSSNARSEGKFRVISASMDSDMWTASLPRDAQQRGDLGYVKARVRPSNETRDDVPTPGTSAFVGRKVQVVPLAERSRLSMPWMPSFSRTPSSSSRVTSSSGAPNAPSRPPASDSNAEKLGKEGVQRMLRNVTQLSVRRTS